MATANTAGVRETLIRARAALETKILRNAARAAAKVVADEAKERCISDEVRGSIGISTDARGDQIIAKVQTKGEGAYIAPWLEYGTSRHIIQFKGDAPAGKAVLSVPQLNKLGKELGTHQGKRPGSLRIGERWVGNAVIHPGASPHPFLRPALDMKEEEAIDAAQAYINAHFTVAGLASAGVADDAA